MFANGYGEILFWQQFSEADKACPLKLMVEFSIVSVAPQFHLLNLGNLVGFSLSMDERMVVLTILIDLLQMESCLAETASVGLRFTRRGGLSV